MGRVSQQRVLRERANMSFCIVVIFFGVFSTIVLTEIFLIDQSSRSRARHHTRTHYEDSVIVAQHGEDYLVYQGGGTLEDTGAQKLVQPSLPQIPANLSITDGSWQVVTGTRYKFFVFSAYLDRRSTRIVRIIGATKTRGPDRVWCLFYYQSQNSTYTVPVPARVKVIRENWNLKYSACFILCPLQKQLSVPDTVSVVSKAKVSPGNRLIINHLFNNSNPPVKPPNRLGVCVKPLHFFYNQSIQMLEFIELNSLLGMDHITFYNDTIGTSVNCILNHYQKLGKITVLPWRLDMASQKEIRTEGLFAALNDCLYRSMYRFSHIALIDLDEYIMPKHNDTIRQFMQWMGQKVNTRLTGSYSFQNAFFYLQWADDVTAGNDPFTTNLVTLRKTRRRAKLHPHKQRSKYICRPEYVIEAGNHFVWEFIPGHGTLNVPADAAILNHYRVCEFGGDDCVKSASVVDRTAFRYKARLVDRVRRKWLSLKHECSLPGVENLRTDQSKAEQTTEAPSAILR